MQDLQQADTVSNYLSYLATDTDSLDDPARRKAMIDWMYDRDPSPGIIRSPGEKKLGILGILPSKRQIDSTTPTAIVVPTRERADFTMVINKEVVDSSPSVKEVRSDPPQKRLTRSSTSVLTPPENELILVYPFNGISAVSIYSDDLNRLRPDEFLNDTIVDLYLK